MLSIGAAIDVPSAGEVRIDGRSLARLDEIELARIRGSELAVVFQSDNLWPTLTARGERRPCLASLAGVDRDPNEAADEALAIFGLEGRAANTPDRLSGGEQQGSRSSRSRTPAANRARGRADRKLDARNESLVLGTLRMLRDSFQSAIVLITHSEAVAGACDRVVEIADGRVAR